MTPNGEILSDVLAFEAGGAGEPAVPGVPRRVFVPARRIVTPEQLAEGYAVLSGDSVTNRPYTGVLEIEHGHNVGNYEVDEPTQAAEFARWEKERLDKLRARMAPVIMDMARDALGGEVDMAGATVEWEPTGAK